MITYLLVTSQGHWPCMVPPGTLAHCRWCLEPWLQILIQVLRAYWCWCQQPGLVGCSKASPLCQGSLRHGCLPLFGQLWKWSQPRPPRECTSPHCPPDRGQCAAERQKREKKAGWVQTLAQIMIHWKHWGRAVKEHHFTKTVKETDCASKSKFMSLQRSAKHQVMRKIKGSYFQSVSRINEAKSLINNAFSQCNYAAMIALQHHGPVAIQAWLKNRLLWEIGVFLKLAKTRLWKPEMNTQQFWNAFTWQQRSLTIWLSARLQNITQPAKEHLC